MPDCTRLVISSGNCVIGNLNMLKRVKLTKAVEASRSLLTSIKIKARNEAAATSIKYNILKFYNQISKFLALWKFTKKDNTPLLKLSMVWHSPMRLNRLISFWRVVSMSPCTHSSQPNIFIAYNNSLIRVFLLKQTTSLYSPKFKKYLIHFDSIKHLVGLSYSRVLHLELMRVIFSHFVCDKPIDR